MSKELITRNSNIIFFYHLMVQNFYNLNVDFLKQSIFIVTNIIGLQHQVAKISGLENFKFKASEIKKI